MKRNEEHFINLLCEQVEELCDQSLPPEARHILHRMNRHINHYMFNTMATRRKEDGISNNS